MSRTVYLIAYDIRDPKRLMRIHHYLIGYKVGGQKSVFECWLTPAELATVQADLLELMDDSCDRIHFLQLDPRQTMQGYGRASNFVPGWFAVL